MIVVTLQTHGFRSQTSLSTNLQHDIISSSISACLDDQNKRHIFDASHERARASHDPHLIFCRKWGCHNLRSARTQSSHIAFVPPHLKHRASTDSAPPIFSNTSLFSGFMSTYRGAKTQAGKRVAWSLWQQRKDVDEAETETQSMCVQSML